MDNSGTQGALNAYLIPVNSPYAQNNGQVSGYEFGYQNEDGVISNAQISSVSAGQITVGTLRALETIYVNDGTSDVVLIGYQYQGF